jgi:hypothetical protein
MAKISEEELSLKYKRPRRGDFIILNDIQHSNAQQKSLKKEKYETLLKLLKSQNEFSNKTANVIVRYHTNPYKNLSIKDLIKIYKRRVSSNQNIDKKLFITLRKKILQSNSQMYDKLAIINALEDIQNKNVDKYEALLIVNTMLKEIK